MSLVTLVPRSYKVIGSLSGKIGPYQITPAKQARWPVRFVEYGPTNEAKYVASWTSARFTMQQSRIATDSVLELDETNIKEALTPGNFNKEGAGAAFLQRGQVHPNFWQRFLRASKADFAPDLEAYTGVSLSANRLQIIDPQECLRPLIILPFLQKEGKNVFGFDLAMAGVKAQDIFQGRDEILEQLELDKDLLFISPASMGSGIFCGDRYEEAQALNYLIGRTIARREDREMDPQAVARFAQEYAKRVSLPSPDDVRIPASRLS
jgi:hypothetical protein